MNTSEKTESSSIVESMGVKVLETENRLKSASKVTKDLSHEKERLQCDICNKIRKAVDEGNNETAKALLDLCTRLCDSYNTTMRNI